MKMHGEFVLYKTKENSKTIGNVEYVLRCCVMNAIIGGRQRHSLYKDNIPNNHVRDGFNLSPSESSILGEAWPCTIRSHADGQRFRRIAGCSDAFQMEPRLTDKACTLRSYALCEKAGTSCTCLQPQEPDPTLFDRLVASWLLGKEFVQTSSRVPLLDRNPK